MIVAETQQRHSLERQVQVIMAFLVPFFFVVTGAKVDVRQLGSVSAVGMVAVVTLLAVVSKLVGCGLAALSTGRRSALIVGVGMVPRGEVGIIVASLGLQAAVFSETLYAVIIAMSLLTSVIAPPVLKALFSGEKPEPHEDVSHLIGVEETGHS